MVVFRRFLGNQPLEAGNAAKGEEQHASGAAYETAAVTPSGIAAAVFPLTHNIRLPLITEANV